MLRRGQVLSCMNEFSGVVLSCFTHSRQTSWTEVLLIQPEDPFIPFFKATVYMKSWVGNLVNCMLLCCVLNTETSMSQMKKGLLTAALNQAREFSYLFRHFYLFISVSIYSLLFSFHFFIELERSRVSRNSWIAVSLWLSSFCVLVCSFMNSFGFILCF